MRIGELAKLSGLTASRIRFYEAAGLILAVQQRYSVGEQMRRILRINRERSSNDMRNRIEFLGSWSGSGPESSIRR